MQALTGKITSFMTRVFGCWHYELSRPISQGGQAHVTCLKCGARRQFDLGNWQMQGRFYYQD